MKTVLVVDDDPQFVHYLTADLEEQGYRVVVGCDGGVAVAQAHVHHPDVILMDVVMPHTNGLRAFEALRSNEKTSEIPVIFISKTVSPVKAVVEHSERVAHLQKPVDPFDIFSLIQRFVGQKPATKPALG